MGQRLGYKQSAEHIARRIKRGPAHPNWKGSDINERSGRCRAQRMFPPGPCIRCGAKGERHHKDGDTSNNTDSNVEMLCRRCHMEEDGRLQAFAEQAKNRDRKKDAR